MQPPHLRRGAEMWTIFALYLHLLTSSTSLALSSLQHHLPLPFAPTPPSPSSPAFLKEIVEAIAAKERWDPEEEVRVTEFDAGRALFGDAQRHEFHIRVGRMVLIVRSSDVDSWRKPGRGEGLGPDSEEAAAAGGGVGSRKGVGWDLELDGPLDVHVDGGDGELSLLFPAMNITHIGLRRVLVDEGITIKMKGAQEVSLSHPYGVHMALHGNSDSHNDDINRPFGHSSCPPLISVRVASSASLVAYRSHNSEAYIKTAYLSHDTVELLPEKCYTSGHLKPIQSYSFGSLRSRLILVEERLQKFLGYRVFQNRATRVLKAKITSPTLVKFRIELERDIKADDRIWKKVAEWRTKPVMERSLFEIVARVGEAKGGLEPLLVKKVKRPFNVADSTAWSNLMANISFTQFPSVVVPPEALTLDVKW